MAAFFSVRVAPGVRVSAGSGGLRAHLGRRTARLHLAGGRTGMSAGTGPFTFSRSPGGAGDEAPRPYATGPTAAEIARAGQEEQAELIAQSLTALGNLHRHTVPSAQPGGAPLGPVPALADLLRAAERRATADLAWHRFGRRRQARRAVRAAVERQAETLMAEAQQVQQAVQARMRERWDRLLANDEDAVLAALALAFEDDAAPVAAVGVTGDDVALAVLVPAPDVLPDRYPTVTEAGDVALRKVTRAIAAEWYRQLVAGHVVVSAKQAFAVCPGLSTATVVVLRDEGADGYGGPQLQPVMATRLSRSRLEGVRWESVTAWDVIEQAGRDTLTEAGGAARELAPLDLTGQPDLAAVAAAVHLGDLPDGPARRHADRA